MKISVLALAAMLSLGGCGIAYHSATVNPLGASDKVRVVPMNAETVLVANQSQYRPKSLPSVFFQTSGGGSGLRGAGPAPDPVIDLQRRPAGIELRIPPPANPGPYRIGVGDVVLLSTTRSGNTVEQLSGLLAAQNARQGYTVRDDGSIAIPNVGRVVVQNLTLEEAEDRLFQRLVEEQIDPTFTLEIAEFNSKRVTVGGAVERPSVVPVTLTPLFLDEVLSAAGGLDVARVDLEFASVRIYRDGNLYQIPVQSYFDNARFRRLQLVDGDSVFVDTTYELNNAQAYFEQQIRLAEFRQRSRNDALQELRTEIDIRRSNLSEARENYLTRVELQAVDRDYVYITGEVRTQGRYELPLGRQATLADAIFDGGAGVNIQTADIRQVYVLRGSNDPREFGAVTAWQMNAKQATNFMLATRFELRPNDVIFIAEQPVTRWNRVINQISPTIIATATNAATD